MTLFRVFRGFLSHAATRISKKLLFLFFRRPFSEKADSFPPPVFRRIPLLQKIFTGIALIPGRKDVPRRRRNFYGLRLFYPQNIRRPAVKCKCPAAKYKTPTAKCKYPAAKHKALGRNVAAGRPSSNPCLCRKESLSRSPAAEFICFSYTARNTLRTVSRPFRRASPSCDRGSRRLLRSLRPCPRFWKR